ncbi:hypothetical protein LTR70_002328 [Exophiala xenobiotica]|uniref:Uncharacterized protein n=1 Tax=Lithohypha guttulata TaxID=1690604 RepID=A0ABR0KM39_9EURO|nr:hypothetical protein LTR24_001250 [Lithohypha guttulata]KAK5326063.1 hypothetical protein LTR70_002328 [Exophiala xenobiotica]
MLELKTAKDSSTEGSSGQPPRSSSPPTGPSNSSSDALKPDTTSPEPETMAATRESALEPKQKEVGKLSKKQQKAKAKAEKKVVGDVRKLMHQDAPRGWQKLNGAGLLNSRLRELEEYFTGFDITCRTEDEDSLQSNYTTEQGQRMRDVILQPWRKSGESQSLVRRQQNEADAVLAADFQALERQTQVATELKQAYETQMRLVNDQVGSVLRRISGQPLIAHLEQTKNAVEYMRGQDEFVYSRRIANYVAGVLWQQYDLVIPFEIQQVQGLADLMEEYNATEVRMDPATQAKQEPGMTTTAQDNSQSPGPAQDWK